VRITNWGANLSVEAAEALLLKCVENGITTVDTADIYGYYDVEQLLGKIFAKNPTLRSKIQIITKCGICLPCPSKLYKLKHYDSTKEHILASVENSLKFMNTSYIDLLLIHRPDPLTHPSEVVEAFKILKQSEKVHYFGVSNYTPSQYDTLNSMLPSNIPLVTNQVQFSLFHVDPLFDGTFDSAIKHGITPQIWSAIGGGRLFVDNANDASALNLRAALQPLAEKYKTTIDNIALAWVLAVPARPAVVLGSTNSDRVIGALKAMDIQLTREEWFFLLQVARGREVA